ncbi:MAG: M48 family metallopeptidase [Candidatus Spyradosoma sp.]
MDAEDGFDLRLPASTRVVRVRLARSSRARRMTLRVQPDGAVSVTIPAGTRGDVLEKARLFALKNLDWIDRRLASAEARDADFPRTLSEYLRERPTIFADAKPLTVEISFTTARPFFVLRPWEDVVPVYVRAASADADLRAALAGMAKALLPPRVRALAESRGVSVGAISVRDQRSRWGSCTTRGDLSLNWRLVLLPPEIRDHVLLHELAHRRHMDHSDDFWDQLYAWDPQTAAHDRALTAEWSRLLRL